MSVDLSSMTSSSANSSTSNPGVPEVKVNLVHRWTLVEKLQKELNDLLEKNSDNLEIKEMKKKLDKIVELKQKVDIQNGNLKMLKVLAMQERNAYLHKLNEIDDYGNNLNWADPDQYLHEIYYLLNDNDQEN